GRPRARGRLPDHGRHRLRPPRRRPSRSVVRGWAHPYESEPLVRAGDQGTGDGARHRHHRHGSPGGGRTGCLGARADGVPEGRGMRKAVAFMYPFIQDKRTWPKPPDVMYYDAWPVRHPALLFGGLALREPRYLDLWKTLPADPTVDEVVRNYPIRQPLLWMRQ